MMVSNINTTAYVCLQDELLMKRLQALACSHIDLQCDYVDSIHDVALHQSPYVLMLDEGCLQLAPKDKSKGSPVVVDFANGTIGFRGRQNVRQELLVKAVLGRNKQSMPRVLDVTGGLGRDSFILACAGCSVTTLERSPVVFLLLADGLYRASMDGSLIDIVGNITLQFEDSIQNQGSGYDVVYMDPMFPERSKSALVKKEMRIFRDVVGEDMDVNQLFEHATQIAKQKVVVKRPRKSAFVMDKKPTYSVEGRSSRFDVYQRASHL